MPTAPPPDTHIHIRIRVAAAVVENGKILLVKHVKNGDEYWMLPGGGLEHGETLHEAAIRELREETGLKITPDRLLFTAESIAPDHHRHIVHVCFLAERRGGELAPSTDPRVAHAAWLPLADLPTTRLYPHFATEIHAALTTLDTPVYLGNRWV